ncbi:hypothetical protein [Floridanema aerugineum]|uniref:hypothetical protein n=1 Tax=Floridanema aerugineum TaxID=3396169 RepID=UPI0039A5B13F
MFGKGRFGSGRIILDSSKASDRSQFEVFPELTAGEKEICNWKDSSTARLSCFPATPEAAHRSTTWYGFDIFVGRRTKAGVSRIPLPVIGG